MGIKKCSGCGGPRTWEKQYYCRDCKYSKNKTYYKKDPKKSYLKSKKWATKKQGVYGIFSGETCLYVGESGWLNKRIADHKSYSKNPLASPHPSLYIRISKHSNVEVRILEETPSHKEQEQVWIDYMCPLYNKNEWKSL